MQLISRILKTFSLLVLLTTVVLAVAQKQQQKNNRAPIIKPNSSATPTPSPIRIDPGKIELPGEAIQKKYQELGGPNGPLGRALTGLGRCPDKIGWYTHYENGSIYWGGPDGAHEVHGAIYDKWAALGWETSVLGYPITDEVIAPDRQGRINHFQNGSIYWTPGTGAHEVHGAIREEWKSLNWQLSVLGYPITDETTTPDGLGRYNHFQGGSIYWTQNTGAHEVHGPILAKWRSMGWEQSYLGYPLSDVSNNVSQFQRGQIQMNSAGVAVDIPATKTFHANVSFNDSTPIGGSVDLTMDAKGNFKWSSRMHNSGAPSYDYVLATVLVTKSALTFPNYRNATLGGTFAGNRQDDWDFTGTDQRIADNWDQIDQTGKFFWRCSTQDTWTKDAGAFVSGLVKDAIKSYVGG